eukprot:4399039-Pleurochrysis_carterae.AAC.1
MAGNAEKAGTAGKGGKGGNGWNGGRRLCLEHGLVARRSHRHNLRLAIRADWQIRRKKRGKCLRATLHANKGNMENGS